MESTSSAFYRTLDPQVSQGDIVDAVPHLYLKTSVTVLRRATAPGGRSLFEAFPVAELVTPPPGGFKFEKGEPEQISSTCHLARGIILSHSCEIDKDSKHRLIALVRPLQPIPAENQEIIRRNQDFSYFHLPACPGAFDESYVDFRRISSIHPDLINSNHRLASLNEEGLGALLVEFFLYITRSDVHALSNLAAKR